MASRQASRGGYAAGSSSSRWDNDMSENSNSNNSHSKRAYRKTDSDDPQQLPNTTQIASPKADRTPGHFSITVTSPPPPKPRSGSADANPDNNNNSRRRRRRICCWILIGFLLLLAGAGAGVYFLMPDTVSRLLPFGEAADAEAGTKSDTDTGVNNNNNILTCGPDPVVLNEGTVLLRKSSNLCTVVVRSSSDGGLRPVGRSYSNHNWEPSAGDFSSLGWSCAASTHCTVDLPPLDPGNYYSLAAFDAPAYTHDDTVARFLQQTTFGITREEIEDVKAAGAPSFWVRDQMDPSKTPVSSHRQFFRRHMNAHFEYPSLQGIVTTPCQKGTQYRMHAISDKDFQMMVDIETIQGKRIIRINGIIRTVVDSIATEAGKDFPDGTHSICGRPWRPYVHDKGRDNSKFSMIHPDDDVCYTVYLNKKRGNTRIVFNETVGAMPAHMIDLDRANSSVKGHNEEFHGGIGLTPPVQFLILTEDIRLPECDLLPAITGFPEDPVFATFGGEVWIHEPRFVVFDNTLEAPLQDAGGAISRRTKPNEDWHRRVYCSNAPRTFLNEEHCFLSTDRNVCGAKKEVDLDIELSHDNMRMIYNVTGGDEGAQTRHVYSVEGLRIQDDEVPFPCEPGKTSRWMPTSCTEMVSNIGQTTLEAFRSLFEKSIDKNPFMRDILFPRQGVSCDSQDRAKKGFSIQLDDGTCYKNVHPNEGQVYDMTFWTLPDTHPGNSPQKNPIKDFALAGKTTLTFPHWHTMDRWRTNRENFQNLGRLGDNTTYRDLPDDLAIDEVFEAFGGDSDSAAEAGVVVCGSPNEVGNDLSLGGDSGRNAFDSLTTRHKTYLELAAQKKQVWTTISLQARDQLRQRMAWALSQILTISPGSIREVEQTESWVNYHDIFVRHAFGNYADVLKEVSYSPMMAEMLTYLDSQSTAAIMKQTNGAKLQFPDENYAREIMQLFTIGLNKMNMDGTLVKQPNGENVLTYTNSDIEELSRVWTGFQAHGGRGNIERGSKAVDPMDVNPLWRDRFPKMGLDGKYIGEGYPLCADLPKKHFLLKGAKYRLVDSDGQPDLQMDPSKWGTSLPAKRLVADKNGELFAALCGGTTRCKKSPVVVLPDDIQCSGEECNVDTIRTVQIQPGLFYEYVRTPCVHQAFYNGAKKIVRASWNADQVMCADPRTDSANSACCDKANSCCSSLASEGFETFVAEATGQVYWGERMTYATAEQKCSSNTLCFSPHMWRFCYVDDLNAQCSFDEHSSTHYWTNADCEVQAKIDMLDGTIAIVHSTPNVDDSMMAQHVQQSTKTFFRVDWGGLSVEEVLNRAKAVCSLADDGSLLCNVVVSDVQVFDETRVPGSIQQVLDTLLIGGFVPKNAKRTVADGVVMYNTGSKLTMDTVFEVVDSNGVKHIRKNVQSMVSIADTDLEFKNPVHFISLADEERRDIHYETQAALDHYMYHPNTAPFVATRIAQRLGHSNPSPRFIKTIATAFKTGLYTSGDGLTFGAGRYGDLAATVAAIVLDREARDILLDADPSHGALVEPLLKIVGLMRSLDFVPKDRYKMINFKKYLQTIIGQEAYEIPSVFSFFLPEYKVPSSRASSAGLVTPEAQVLTTPKILNTMNGLHSLLRIGFDECQGGLGGGNGCRNKHNWGDLTFKPSGTTSKEIVDELATLLTAGRLSPENRALARALYDKTPNTTANPLAAAQQLIVSSGEFHSTGITRMTGKQRVKPTQEKSTLGKDNYKATVILLLTGGYDSWNMLVPHRCSGTNSKGKTVREQYESERGLLALIESERKLPINVDPEKQQLAQPCEEFVVHPELKIVHELFNAGDLSFFANAGVLNRPVNKHDFATKTKTRLFAHNAMQQEAQRVDPFVENPDTGVLGRIVSILNNKKVPGQNTNYKVSGTSIDRNAVAVRGIPGQSPTPIIMSRSDVKTLLVSTDETEKDLFDAIQESNGETTATSNMYAEIWSDKLTMAIDESDHIKSSIDAAPLKVPLTTTERYDEVMAMATRIIQSHKVRGVDRDIIYTDMDGWDHHSQMKTSLRANFVTLNRVLTHFVEELKANDLWNNVNLVVTSDFGRTLTPNSNDGSDHAWGGHYFMMGGSVAGGKIHGQYPSDITAEGPLNIGRGRGRMIPTLSWESIWNGVAQHMGVDDDVDLDICLPNRHAVGATLFSKEDLFDEPRRRLRRG